MSPGPAAAVLLSALLALGPGIADARAMIEFKKAFAKHYVDDSNNAQWQADVKKANCHVCHVGKDRQDRNPYGEALASRIEGSAKERLAEARKNGGEALAAEKKKLLEELEKAFAEVESEKSPAGETYGDRLKAGKLPVPLEAK